MIACDDERNQHLSTDVPIDLLLGLGLHCVDRIAVSLPAFGSAASKQEGQKKQNIDDVFDDMSRRAEKPQDEVRDGHVVLGQVGESVSARTRDRTQDVSTGSSVAKAPSSTAGKHT